MPSSDADIIQELRAAARRHAASTSTFPWVVGYEQARAIREQIAPDSKTRLTVDRYIASTVRKAPDVSLQALGAGASHPHPLVVIGQNRPAASKRFTLSRALWHYLWDDSPLFMVTAAHTYRQRVERAFAAELLAPAEGIAQLLESPPEAASQEELEQIAPDSKTRLAVDRYIASTVRKAPDVSLQALGAGASHPHPLVVIGQNRPAASNLDSRETVPSL